MSYEKHTWQTGEVITAENLNHIEDGLASGGVLLVNENVEGQIHTLDKTWQQIHDATFSIKVLVDEDEGQQSKMPITVIGMAPNYSVMDNYGSLYRADSPNGYPSRSEEDSDVS